MHISVCCFNSLRENCRDWSAVLLFSHLEETFECLSEERESCVTPSPQRAAIAHDVTAIDGCCGANAAAVLWILARSMFKPSLLWRTAGRCSWAHEDRTMGKKKDWKMNTCHQSGALHRNCFVQMNAGFKQSALRLQVWFGEVNKFDCICEAFSSRSRLQGVEIWKHHFAVSLCTK